MQNGLFVFESLIVHVDMFDSSFDRSICYAKPSHIVPQGEPSLASQFLLILGNIMVGLERAIQVDLPVHLGTASQENVEKDG